MKSQGLGNMGVALEEALGTAEAEGREVRLPDVDRTMVLALVRTHRQAHETGNLTVDAQRRVSGDIVLGPYATRRDAPTMANLERLLQAHRWVLNPVHLGDGKAGHDGVVRRPAHTIVGPPTISLMHRVETVCKACGHTEREWKDVIIMRSKPGDGSNHRVTRWSPDIIADCNQCRSLPVAQRKLWCTATRKRDGSADDPVINDKERERILDLLLKTWQAGPPADGQATITLPRIWAVYRTDQVPDTAWQPEDARAQQLVDKAAAFQRTVNNAGVAGLMPYPLAILPYEVACKYHQPPAPLSTGVIKFWLESDPVAIGWVPKCDLFPNEVTGFRRRLWHDPRPIEPYTENTNILV